MAKAPDTSGHMRRAQVELRWDHLQSDSVTVGEFRAGSAGLCRHSLAEGVRPTVLSLSRHPDGKDRSEPSQQIVCRQIVSPWLSCSESTECLLRGLGYVFCSVGYDYQLIDFTALNSLLSKMN